MWAEIFPYFNNCCVFPNKKSGMQERLKNTLSKEKGSPAEKEPLQRSGGESMLGILREMRRGMNKS